MEKLRDAIQGKPKLEGRSQLPEYFPVEPAGCEKHAQTLFACLANEATAKARDMEKAGLHKSYYPDVTPRAADEAAAQAVKDAALQNQNGGDDSTEKKVDALPTVNDNPLDECRDAIAYYKRCCDRELKKKKNWILTEPYRVQEEYRYQQQQKE